VRASGGFGMRLKGLIRKEFLQIKRDPSSIAIAFVLPLILLFIFGYGVSLDAEHVPIAVVAERPDARTADLTAAFRGSPYFEPVVMRDMDRAEEALAAGDVLGIVRMRSDFSRRLFDPEGAPIQVIVNGVDANTGRLVFGYVRGVWNRWLAGLAEAEGAVLAPPIDLRQRIWFNIEVRSRNFLVPGLLAVIMTLIGALLTAMVVAREWERGTMEALMSTPVRMGEIVLGKVIPYFLLAMGGMALSTLMAVFLFEVPLRGSLGLLVLASALFVLVSLGMGLLISTVARSQFVAGQVAIIVTFLPAFILSGFIFDIGSMPLVIRQITYLVPARYFVSILQTLFLAGDEASIIVPNCAALAGMAVFFLALVRRKSRKKLD